MKIGDTCWSWAPLKAGEAPVRPRLLTARLAGCEEVGLYDDCDALVMWADRAEGLTAPTEAEAMVGWRAAVVGYVTARRRDDEALIAAAFHGHPDALDWAESVTATIARLEAERDAARDAVRPLLAALEMAGIGPYNVEADAGADILDRWEWEGDMDDVAAYVEEAIANLVAEAHTKGLDEGAESAPDRRIHDEINSGLDAIAKALGLDADRSDTSTIVDAVKHALAAWEHRVNNLCAESHARAALHRDQMAVLEAAQRWIPVAERLPEKNRGEGVLVVVVVNGRRWKWPVIAYLQDDGVHRDDGLWWAFDGDDGDGVSFELVTHWCPLPNGPTLGPQTLPPTHRHHVSGSDVSPNPLTPCEDCNSEFAP